MFLDTTKRKEKFILINNSGEVEWLSCSHFYVAKNVVLESEGQEESIGISFINSGIGEILELVLHRCCTERLL